MTDTLIVYGARCAWWGDISETANMGPGRSGIPTCPHCRGVLFQMSSADWWQGVERYQAAGHPDYRAFVEWLRGRCFPTIGDAQLAFTLRERKD